MFAIVPAIAPGMLDVVPSKDQGAFHHLIGHPPVTAIDVLIARTVLKINPDRFGLSLANQCGVNVATAQTDISPDAAKDPPKRIGSFPGGGERADRATARPGDAAIIAI